MAAVRCLAVVAVVLAAVVGGAAGRRGGGGEVRTVTVRELRRGRESAGGNAVRRSALHSKESGNVGGAAVLQLRHSSTLTPAAKLSHAQLLAADNARAASFQRRLVKPTLYSEAAAAEARVPLSSGVHLQTLNYVTTITLGTAASAAVHTVIVDTGSDLTWVQCKPCASCYIQQEPLFDPAESPSFAAVECSSPSCSPSLRSGGCPAAANTTCGYALSYGDGSYTRGVLAADRVSLGGAAVDRFVFGCGRSNRGLFGGASGLMGLGRSELSLVSQTKDRFAQVFSYCLPAGPSAAGSLVLGDGASSYRNTTPVSYTPIGSDSDDVSFYFLTVTGIAVGGVPLGSAAFAGVRTLIDSGTVITRLPPSIYSELKAEFVGQFAEYPRAPGFSILDTCFNLSAYDQVRVPTVRLTFGGGADMSVDAAGTLYVVKKDASLVCLAVASLAYDGQVGIIGNYQQKNKRVVYDIGGGRVGFAEEDCSDLS